VPQIDPNSFSRTYLDHTIRNNSQPALPPNVPLNVHQQASPNNSNSGYSAAAIPVSQQGVNGVPAGASPRATTNGMTGGGNTNDIKTMEDDLRRMLKLNVLSN
jgi:hypothetical protein